MCLRMLFADDYDGEHFLIISVSNYFFNLWYVYFFTSKAPFQHANSAVISLKSIIFVLL